MFLDDVNLFMFDRRNDRRSIDIGLQARLWTLLRRWCPDTMKDVFWFDMLIVRHTQEVSYLHRSLSFVRNVVMALECRELHQCCFEDPIDGFHGVKDADGWWREMEFEGR